MNLTLARSKILTSQTAWLESLALTAVVVAIGYGINPADPFYLNNSFPWLMLAPLLIALRYGFLFGMSSTFVFIILFTAGRYFNWAIVPVFPVEMVVGMLLVTMITAEFHDIWQQKIQPLQYKYHHLTLRMNEFSRAYHVLKASHSQMEQQTANHVKSLRTALLDIKQQILTLAKNEGAPLDGIGTHILDILSEYGSIQTASVYAVSDDKKIILSPIASLGNPPPLWPTNHIVMEALNTGHVTSIQTHNESVDHEILVVIPLIDVLHKIWGVVIINEMSLFAMQENTLDLLALLGGHIGDLIRRRTEAHSLGNDAWLDFEYELRRVLKNILSFKINAAVVISIISNVKTQEVFISRFRSELRGLDKVFNFQDEFGRQIIIKLLPLTDEQGLKNFLARLDLVNSIDIETLTDFEAANVSQTLENDLTIYSWILNDKHSPEKVLPKIEKLCQLNESANKNGEYVCDDISA
jgi:polysaccharide biosynthesis protein PelD